MAKPDITVYDINLTRTGIIDDYADLVRGRGWREIAQTTVSINRNLPNAALLVEGAVLIIGDDMRDSYKIVSLSDKIDSDGKVSQVITAECEDLRCLLKQRKIMDLNSDGMYTDTGVAETVLKNLVDTQCVSSSDSPRNFSTLTIASDETRGSDVSISTKYTSVYDMCVAISKQSNLGWFIYPDIDNAEYILDCAVGNDLTSSVFFDDSFESLQEADYTESILSYRNLVYVGGSGAGVDRIIHKGYTDATEPSGFNRYEEFTDAAELSATADLETKAAGVLEESQITSSVSIVGLQKSPFIYKENYNTGDVVTVRFNDKTFEVRIYKVFESWENGGYDISFEIGKPVPLASTQIGTLASLISNNAASSEAGTNNTGMRQGILDIDVSSANVVMNGAQCIYNILNIKGEISADRTVQFYFDDETFIGRKAYHLLINATVASTAYKIKFYTSVTSSRYYEILINAGQDAFYIDLIVDSNGDVNSTKGFITRVESLDGSVELSTADGERVIFGTDKNIIAPTAQTASTATLADRAKDSYPIPTDAVLQYSFDEIKQLPDNPTGTVYIRDNDWATVDGWTTSISSSTLEISGGVLVVTPLGTQPFSAIAKPENYAGKKVAVIVRKTSGTVKIQARINDIYTDIKNFTQEIGENRIIIYAIMPSGSDYVRIYSSSNTETLYVETVYIGDGSYIDPVIDNSYSEAHAENHGVIPVDGVCGKAGYFNNSYMIAPRPALGDDITIYFWAKFDALGIAQIIVQSSTVKGEGLTIAVSALSIYRLEWRGDQSYFTGYTPPVNTWHHVCVKMNSTTKVLKINGETKVTLTGTYGITTALASSIWSGMLGTGGTPSGYFLTGALDGLKIVPRYTTDDEDIGEYKARANHPKFYTYERYLIENL